MIDRLVPQSQQSTGSYRTTLDQTLRACRVGGGRGGNLQNALASWESVLPHTQKTYHPMLLARFQSLMTFVNHQPVCLHRQTLPTDTPFHTKAVAIPFKRGSLKAPLCSREENKNLFPSKLQAFRNNATKAFLAVCLLGKLEPGLRNLNTNDGSAQGKRGTFGVRASTQRWNSSLCAVHKHLGLFRSC